MPFNSLKTKTFVFFLQFLALYSNFRLPSLFGHRLVSKVHKDRVLKSVYISMFMYKEAAT